uniref:LOB domain-containing protein n=1 Tax=Nelumbo nucifera TaxID=4432 RepID=A0A822Z9F0_NELNU|nr:TPA_asm: hypothetical protein HUJ06_015800 [Nelumbo nucifera]
MSCNGCRVLRKGCSESCVLRHCLQWIENPEAQGHATVFVAKFFGRAGLMSFMKTRDLLFQSLLYEACGRTVNPVSGAVGLLWTGNWHVCQSAVETVLRGGTLRPMTDFLAGILMHDTDEASEVEVPCSNTDKQQPPRDLCSRSRAPKRRGLHELAAPNLQPGDLDLSLMPGLPKRVATGGRGGMMYVKEKRRPVSPSMNSEESVTTSFDSEAVADQTRSGERKLLNLFV